MGNKIKIAAVQMDCTPDTVSKRLARAAGLIAEAANDGAELIVLPELFNTGYEYHERNYALAETIDGQTVTWMKAQAAHHNIHLAGTLLLLDETDIYNAAPLVAPDGRMWRYDKMYVPLWERAYFRGGQQITVADTDLGKLGMMICWDQAHPDLWKQYAGQVDAIVIMSCPGNLGTADLVFPDGFRGKFMELGGQQPDNYSLENNSDNDTNDRHRQAAWMKVPVVSASATGTIRTNVPLLEGTLGQSPFADRIAQASETLLEAWFEPETQIIDANGETLAQGTAIGDGIVFADVELADVAPSLSETTQPTINIPPDIYHVSDEAIPSMMIPLYKDGVRRQWGQDMAPDELQ